MKFLFARTFLNLRFILVQLTQKYPALKLFLIKIIWLFPGLKSFYFFSQNRPELYQQLKSTRKKRVVLIDVTHQSKTKINTGIQRVVRAILNQFNEIFPSNVDIEPIILTCEKGFWHFVYLTKDKNPSAEIVVPRKNDVFLGLDLNAEVIYAAHAGLFDDWKSRGAKIIFTVHDILPIYHPEWWPKGVAKAHTKWLKTVLDVSETIISVSNVTSLSVQTWAKKNHYNLDNYNFEWFHLGADIESSSPTMGLPDTSTKTLAKLSKSTTFLVVGTLEPRKGHYQCLAAFELLWNKGININLVFVGKEGWMVSKLMNKIQSHPQAEKQFFWLDGISDEYLEKVYESASCLMAISEGEGFGLPLIEAAQHSLPIIARDISIFKEVAGDHAFYFEGNTAKELATKIKDWLALYSNNKHPTSDNIPWQTWRQSAEKLRKIIEA